MAAVGSGADPEIDDPRLHDADDANRNAAAVFFRHELPAYFTVGRRVDRRHASAPMGAVGGNPGHGRSARLLSAAGFDHPDDRADYPAAASSGELRHHLVRRRDDDRDGDGSYSPTG